MRKDDLHKNKQKSFALAIVFILAIIAGIFGYSLFEIKEKFNEKGLKEESEVQAKFVPDNKEEDENLNFPLAPRVLDGVMVREGSENNMPVAIMIENHVDSRPSAGISKAQLVFEVPVEGGITRFMAVFSEYQKLDKIGPIRSARPYYLDWAQGLNAMYLHVGGSPEALRKIKAYKVRDLDQYYLYQYYWRADERRAPHNVYTQGELLARALRDKDLAEEKGDFKSWKYISEPNDLEGEDRDIEDLVINFSSPAYQARWKYDQEKGLYFRYQGEIPHLDEDGIQISASNIVLVYTSIVVIDEEGRLRIKTIGSGESVLFKAGNNYDAKWEKLSRTDRLNIFIDEEQAEFIPGTTWVEVVSEFLEITY